MMGGMLCRVSVSMVDKNVDLLKHYSIESILEYISLEGYNLVCTHRLDKGKVVLYLGGQTWRTIKNSASKEFSRCHVNIQEPESFMGYNIIVVMEDNYLRLV